MYKKIVFFTLLLSAFTFMGFLLGFMKANKVNAVSEFKVIRNNYKNYQENDALKSYFKLRMYYLANLIPEELINEELDQGPVAEHEVPKGVAIGKEPGLYLRGYKRIIKQNAQRDSERKGAKSQ